MSPIRLLSVALLSVGCGDPDFDAPTGAAPALLEKALPSAARRARLIRIRDAAGDAGLKNAAMLAGIAAAETGLAHCWHEATWACQGPWSADCDGPVIAGAGDGPCAWREGGLGLFQFDAGTFDATLRREGHGVLSLAGNVERAVDFVARMLVRSAHVRVSTRAEALRWLADVRPGTADFDAWIKTVTHHYNGCAPGICSVYWQRYDHYAHHAKRVFEEQGGSFWTRGGATEAPPPELAAIEVWWRRAPDGSYELKALAPERVTRVDYSVDGYSIARSIPRDDPGTAAEEKNFPARYRFSVEAARRRLVVVGFDAAGRPVARGVGSIDIVPGTAVFIRQQGEALYQIGLERAPEAVHSLSVEADGVPLTDALTGDRRSERLVVRSHFMLLGERRFVLTGYDAHGTPVLRSERRFTLE